VEGSVRTATPVLSTCCFNGATTKESWKALLTISRVPAMKALQWGHDKGVVEGPVARRIPALAGKLQWGHDKGVVEGCQCRLISGELDRFNGATTKESWKASDTRLARDLACTGFNGATTKESWKALTALLNAFIVIKLQWGHDKGVVEGKDIRSPTLPGEPASMGPRQRSRGRRGGLEGCARRRALQWGHDKGVVEGIAPATSVAELASASMGPRQRSRGRLASVITRCVVVARFNGATTKESWKAGLFRWRRRAWRCFNGATTKESWKAPSNHRASLESSTLQWGHDKGVVEGQADGERAGQGREGFNGATTKESWKAGWTFGFLMS